jgi:hypothetical protein
MAGATQKGLSSVFDEIVAKNKKRFDDLFAGEGAGSNVLAATKSFPGGGRDTATHHAASQPLPDPASSVAVRRLKERFGNDWRYEIADRQRDGDEAIVLCKLTFGKEGAARAQFGRATLSQGSVAGASDGVRFTSGALGAESGEADAFRRATEAALMSCLDLI